jgi:hypothetical protein
MSWGTRFAQLGVTIAMVALATVGLRLSEEVERFEVVSGVVGETLMVENGQVTATEVRIGNGIKEYGEVGTTTEGAFLMVRVTFAATGSEILHLGEARVRGDDLNYRGYRTTNSGGPRLPPGFEESTDLIFEVDPSRMADLVLDLAPNEFLSGYGEHVRVHLGITAENAAQWQAAAANQPVEPKRERRRALP